MQIKTEQKSNYTGIELNCAGKYAYFAPYKDVGILELDNGFCAFNVSLGRRLTRVLDNVQEFYKATQRTKEPLRFRVLDNGRAMLELIFNGPYLNPTILLMLSDLIVTSASLIRYENLKFKYIKLGFQTISIDNWLCDNLYLDSNIERYLFALTFTKVETQYAYASSVILSDTDGNLNKQMYIGTQFVRGAKS